MVNKPFHPGEISDKAPHVIGRGRIKRGRRTFDVSFPEPLAEQIRNEALARGWPIAKMVRHLCEASIEGIE